MFTKRAFLVLLLPASVVHAWFDPGHSTIAAIARQQMHDDGNDDLIDRLEQVLQYENDDYQNFTDLITGAIWPDHIKCVQDDGVICTGTPRYDDFKLFNDFHYNDIPADFGCGVKEVPDDQISYLVQDEQVGAGTTLNHIFKSTISDYVPPSVNVPVYSNKAVADMANTGGRGRRRRLADTSSTFNQDNHMTPWSLGILVKLAAHIYGDIHQPLHGTAGFSPLSNCGSDQGGNLIPVATPLCGNYDNLHSLWDSGVCLFTDSWPVWTADDATSMAAKLMDKYDVNYFSSTRSWSVDADFVAILKESYGLAKSDVYNTIDMSGTKTGYVFTPSVDYINNGVRLSEERITIAGYRLAKYLTRIAKNIPDSVVNSAQDMRRFNERHGYAQEEDD